MKKQVEKSPVLVSEGQVHGYRVVYEQIPTSWGAYAPDLPGLGVVGDSREEVERLIAEAIPIHLEELALDRQERPWLYRSEELSPELRAIFARIDAA
ncbi:MAG TPA: type II toxin-antitoxin system HicB family antitoxin [Chloroflexota bacterium]|nr:type II toxin-antitoxin system HicB family antitoxin [Chloroflexota bacterium]